MGEGAALIDYHGWRYGENIGIFCSVIIGFYIPTCTDLILTLLGGWLAGSFLYERALNYVVQGDLFKQDKTEYHIMGLVIPTISLARLVSLSNWSSAICVGIDKIIEE